MPPTSRTLKAKRRRVASITSSESRSISVSHTGSPLGGAKNSAASNRPDMKAAARYKP
jgi:hypothetical protein